MTVAQIIGQIGALPREDQQKVITFARRLEGNELLSPDELTSLAAELAKSGDDDSRAAALNEQILKGFYGNE